jgi:hypothetical protein
MVALYSNKMMPIHISATKMFVNFSTIPPYGRALPPMGADLDPIELIHQYAGSVRPVHCPPFQPATAELLAVARPVGIDVAASIPVLA